MGFSTLFVKNVDKYGVKFCFASALYIEKERGMYARVLC